MQIRNFLFFILLFPSAFIQSQISIPDASFTYTQDFDGLSNSGTGNAWTDNATILGWYSTRTTYNAGSGTSTTGALYSFGTTSDTERSLGSVASGGTNTIYYGIRFVNNTGSIITQLAVSYFGEQWRNGGNTTAHDLTFSYQIGATSLTTGSWTDVSQLTFTSPIATASASALDGNDAANRTQLNHSLVINLAPGEEVWFRWEDLNDSGNDHGLSVDDFNISAVVLPVTFGEVIASVSQGAVDITFSTAEEINNDYFIVERSHDGHIFLELSKIYAVGNTNRFTQYEYKDENPNSGVNYYRIKQVDFDGKSSYSQVVKASVSRSGVEVFVFGTRQHIVVKSEDLLEKVSVFSLSGQPILTAYPQGSVFEIDHQAWPSGYYLVQVTREGQTMTKKIWK